MTPLQKQSKNYSNDLRRSGTNLPKQTWSRTITVISGAKDEGYNLKYNNKRIDSQWNQLS
jgi:conjugal transfer/entry exclusion protein